MLSMMIVGFSYSQENSNNSSGSSFFSLNSEPEKSLLNLETVSYTHLTLPTILLV